MLYSTVYADGQNELGHRDFSSGYGRETTDDAGNLHVSWVVPAAAPLGRAEVSVGTIGSAIEKVAFTIVDGSGRCT